MSATADADLLVELALQLSQHKPRWTREDSPVKMRWDDRRYYVLDELEASRVNTLVEIVPKLVAALLARDGAAT